MSSGKKTKSKSVVLARRKLQSDIRKKLHNKNNPHRAGLCACIYIM